MPPADKSAWQRLGRLLADRRVQVATRYKNKNLFAAEREINRRMVWRIETGAASAYRDDTVRAIEAAYELAPGSLRRTLAGGELEPADAWPDAPAVRPVLVPELPSGPLADMSDEEIELIIASLESAPQRRIAELAWHYPDPERHARLKPRSLRIELLEAYLGPVAGAAADEPGPESRGEAG